ncbi:hypothetical protein BN946_scf184912.g37 [Trametes cinnabarina]|uniref:Uncharacterized protein n=1 Tax=Pycnoporus cinnabarinus TaxID=5643 RepID=A0A060SYA9_PYCCI|nr:hypothetical protein BN946_scf184912.g37 [Trametes cinnabarina]
MVEYHLGLTPGVIVGLVLILVVLTAMLVSTVVVVWRSRPAAIARSQQRQLELRQKKAAAAAFEKDLESGTGATPPIGILKKVFSRASPDRETAEGEGEDKDAESVDGSPYPELDTPRFPSTGTGGNTDSVSHSGSTVNVIISPSSPHLFKLASDGAGGVEVRVTPPTPSQSMAALKTERRVRFEQLAHMQGDSESVWWFI